jgi:hypothetical protein
MTRLSRLAGTVVLASAFAACHGSTGPAGLPTKACDDAAQVAASAAPNGVSPDLDVVLQACSTQVDLEAAGSKYPAVFGGADTVTIATARCRELGGSAAIPVCIALLATPGPS